MEADVSEAIERMFGPDEDVRNNHGHTHPPSAPPSTDMEISQVHASSIMDTQSTADSMSGRADLGVTHFQCLAARNAANMVEVTSLSTDTTFGRVFKTDTEQVGTLNPPGDVDVLKTFHGGRVKRLQDTVNQSVTMSIDPATLTCIVCSREHSLLKGNKPIVIALSDQNFVAQWPNGTCGDSCTVVVRIANPSLQELVDMVLEIMDRQSIPDGSVLLIGSVSYLHRVGVTCYTREWTNILGRIGRRWPNSRVGPLIPIIRENCIGTVARDIIEYASWIANVYSGTPEGFLEVWNKVVPKTIECSVGQTALNSPELYKVTMPAGLDSRAPDLTTTFQVNNSRPSILYGMDQGTVSVLVGTLVHVLDGTQPMEPPGPVQDRPRAVGSRHQK